MSRGSSRPYAVRSVWRHDPPTGTSSQYTYEERIVFYLAKDFDEAISKAVRDASAYDGECLGYHMAYEMDDGPIEGGSELFSLMRDSDLPSAEYIDRFYDTGAERTQ
ncbi:hypothetical protein GYB59_07190 [bacterium]|nr:hypothetical protein [bacterium]